MGSSAVVPRARCTDDGLFADWTLWHREKGTARKPHSEIDRETPWGYAWGVALAWLLQRDVIAIPKASSSDHVREKRAALDLTLTKRDFIELDEAFPPPP